MPCQLFQPTRTFCANTRLVWIYSINYTCCLNLRIVEGVNRFEWTWCAAGALNQWFPCSWYNQIWIPAAFPIPILQSHRQSSRSRGNKPLDHTRFLIGTDATPTERVPKGLGINCLFGSKNLVSYRGVELRPTMLSAAATLTSPTLQSPETADSTMVHSSEFWNYYVLQHRHLCLPSIAPPLRLLPTINYCQNSSKDQFTL